MYIYECEAIFFIASLLEEYPKSKPINPILSRIFQTANDSGERWL